MIFLINLRACGNYKNGLATLSLTIAILSFFVIIFISVLTACGVKNFGYLFWATECIALSMLVSYVPILALFGSNTCTSLSDFLNPVYDKVDKSHNNKLKDRTTKTAALTEHEQDKIAMGLNIICWISVVFPMVYLYVLPLFWKYNDESKEYTSTRTV